MTVSAFSVMVTVTLSLTGSIFSVPSTITNSTFVKFLLVFLKSPETMPTGYSPASVPFAVHALVGFSATFFSTS